MKLLYLECNMGAAGDMLTAALLELLSDEEKSEFLTEINCLGLQNVEISANTVKKCGITGTSVTVKIGGDEESEHMHEHHDHEHDHEHEHHHRHSGMHDIENIVGGLKVSEKVKKDVLSVYGLIAEAESIAHGVSVSEIHFHEVGTMDAVADITSVCVLMEKIHPDRVIVSPVHVGCGTVKCAHGILPVPAPATAYILKDCPVYGGEVRGELCTPTGAALLKYFADGFGHMPAMNVSKIGYGMGKKDFDIANCVRAFYGESEERIDDGVCELCCNIDDMTGEEIGFATERLLEEGALDVLTEAVYMKKNRPGTVIRAICKKESKDKMVRAIFKYTTTTGIREYKLDRYVLERSTREHITPYGIVREKISKGYGVGRRKYEYDDIAKIARAKDISLKEARKEAEDEK
ncbi:MAG: nickel pincer cofactor biosynthesis protein LarC [Clostridia bacterium]|nr:nickel pincer cofactor biosynthesis protein LarC [Clostridia bacterium]